MIEFLVAILVLLIVVWALHLVIGSLGLPAPIQQVAYLIVALIALFWLLGILGIAPYPRGLSGWPR